MCNLKYNINNLFSGHRCIFILSTDFKSLLRNYDFILQLDGDKAMRQVIIYPGEDGYWVAECPSLPGCVSQGKSKEDAIVNIREAIQVYVSALEEDGLPVPAEHFEALIVAV